MSVLIKGIQMPKNCSECPCWWVDGEAYAPSFCMVGSKYTEDPLDYTHDKDTLPDDCPLIALPEKHGDLIDKNTIEWYKVKASVSVSNNSNKDFGLHDFVLMDMRHINELPVVIKAEGEDKQ